MSTGKVFVALLCVCALLGSAHGWWHPGHQKVALEAWQHMNGAARKALAKGEVGEDRNVVDHFEAFKVASSSLRGSGAAMPAGLLRALFDATYLDDLKMVFKRVDYDKLHFYGKSLSYDIDTKSCQRDTSGKIELRNEDDYPHVEWALDNVVKALKGEKPDRNFQRLHLSKNELYAFLIHLVGDIYQPFHVASTKFTCLDHSENPPLVREQSDVGGNFNTFVFGKNGKDLAITNHVWNKLDKNGNSQQGDITMWPKYIRSMHFMFDSAWGLLPVTDMPNELTPEAQFMAMYAELSKNLDDVSVVEPVDVKMVLQDALDRGVDAICNTIYSLVTIKTASRNDRPGCQISSTPNSETKLLEVSQEISAKSLKLAGRALAGILNGIYPEDSSSGDEERPTGGDNPALGDEPVIDEEKPTGGDEMPTGDEEKPTIEKLSGDEFEQLPTAELPKGPRRSKSESELSFHTAMGDEDETSDVGRLEDLDDFELRRFESAPARLESGDVKTSGDNEASDAARLEDAANDAQLRKEDVSDLFNGLGGDSPASEVNDPEDEEVSEVDDVDKLFGTETEARNPYIHGRAPSMPIVQPDSPLDCDPKYQIASGGILRCIKPTVGAMSEYYNKAWHYVGKSLWNVLGYDDEDVSLADAEEASNRGLIKKVVPQRHEDEEERGKELVPNGDEEDDEFEDAQDSVDDEYSHDYHEPVYDYGFDGHPLFINGIW